MQYRPTSAQLLDALATLLDDVLLPALPAPLQHQARVGANLARIVERELTLGPNAMQRERARLADAVGVDDPVELAAMLRTGTGEHTERAVWGALVETVREDLAIAKPGYDAWQGG